MSRRRSTSYVDHMGNLGFQRDHERYVYLNRQRWRHLPFTYDDVAKRQDYVIESMREAVPLSVLLRSGAPYWALNLKRSVTSARGG